MTMVRSQKILDLNRTKAFYLHGYGSEATKRKKIGKTTAALAIKYNEVIFSSQKIDSFSLKVTLVLCQQVFTIWSFEIR